LKRLYTFIRLYDVASQETVINLYVIGVFQIINLLLVNTEVQFVLRPICVEVLTLLMLGDIGW